MSWFKRNKKPQALSAEQRKFLCFKSARNRIYPLNLEDIRYDFEANKVSVLLPTKNAGDMLPDCIDSILSQTYRNIELIIIDCGSTDQTRAIIKRQATMDKRIKLIFNDECKDLKAAEKLGFNEANGEFLMSVATNNVLLDNCLEIMVGDLQQNKNIGAVFADAQILNERGKIVETVKDSSFICRSIVAEMMGIPGCQTRLKLSFQTERTTSREPLILCLNDDNSLIYMEKSDFSVKNDFYQDFFLSPLVWFINFDKNDEIMQTTASEFKEIALSSGQLCVEKEDLQLLRFGKKTRCCVAVNFGNSDNSIELPKGTIELNADKRTNSQTLFSFLDCKAKNLILSDIENKLNSIEYSRKISIILCANKKSDELIKSLYSLCKQTIDKNDFEIIFVNSSFKDMRVAKVFSVFANEFPDINLKYISSPIEGIFHARNTGANAAIGEVLLFLNDDIIAEADLAEQMYLAIKEKSDNQELPSDTTFGIRAETFKKIGGFRVATGKFENESCEEK